MYLATFMNWSDIGRGEGNPQTMVALCKTREAAEALVVKQVNNEWGPDEPVTTYLQAKEFLKEAPESPELDISEIELFGEFFYLQRSELDEYPRTSNGYRGAPSSWDLSWKRKVLRKVEAHLKQCEVPAEFLMEPWNQEESAIRQLVEALIERLQRD